MSSPYEQLRIRFYIHQNSPGDDFGVSKIKVKQACLNKLQYFIVRRIGAFAVLEYHHSDTDAFAPIQYIIRSKSVRFPQDLTDAAFGAAGSIRNRTNLGVFSNEHVHRATHSSSPTHQSISGRCWTGAYFRDGVKLGSGAVRGACPFYPSRADIVTPPRHVRKVPKAEVSKSHRQPVTFRA